MTIATALTPFAAAYITAAFWSTNDESTESGGEPLDRKYSISDLSPETLEKMQTDCAAFEAAYGHLFTDENCSYTGCTPTEYAGHDFWLTRCRHGCGFWDGDWAEPAATVLTDAAHACGEVELYIGDNGKIYSM